MFFFFFFVALGDVLLVAFVVVKVKSLQKNVRVNNEKGSNAGRDMTHAHAC